MHLAGAGPQWRRPGPEQNNLRARQFQRAVGVGRRVTQSAAAPVRASCPRRAVRRRRRRLARAGGAATDGRVFTSVGTPVPGFSDMTFIVIHGSLRDEAPDAVRATIICLVIFMVLLYTDLQRKFVKGWSDDGMVVRMGITPEYCACYRIVFSFKTSMN